MRIMLAVLTAIWILLFGLGVCFHGHAPAQVAANIMTSSITNNGIEYQFHHNRFESLLLFGSLPVTALAFAIFVFAHRASKSDPIKKLASSVGSVVLGISFFIFVFYVFQVRSEFLEIAASSSFPDPEEIVDGTRIAASRIKLCGLGVCVGSVMFIASCFLSVKDARDNENSFGFLRILAWPFVLSILGVLFSGGFCYLTIHQLYVYFESSVTLQPSELARLITRYFSSAMATLTLMGISCLIASVLVFAGPKKRHQDSAAEDHKLDHKLQG